MAGIAALYAGPLYSNVGPEDRKLEYASTTLACIAFAVLIPVYVIYWCGPAIRARSKFAQSLDKERKEKGEKRTIAADEEDIPPNTY